MFEPAEGINYNFILGMYCFFLALGALFLCLEFVVHVEAVKGFYLIFSPFVPAFLWRVRPRPHRRSSDSIATDRDSHGERPVPRAPIPSASANAFVQTRSFDRSPRARGRSSSANASDPLVGAAWCGQDG